MRRLLVAASAALLLAAPAHAEPRPILRGNFADPAVERVGKGYVAVATGPWAPRARARTRGGTWRRTGPALLRLPAWSRPGDVWAADLVRVRGWWLLYYSAPVRGVGRQGRCIGVARSRSPLRGLRPVGRAPLVCPAYAKVPAAQDQLLPRDRTLPRAGVIDPSVFVGDEGRFLLYKTDRIPSSIRLVELNRSGTRIRRGAVSQELLRSPHVVENPVLVSRPQGWVMLLSEGDYTRCSYRTTWRRSTSLTDWTAAESGVLVDRASSGLCGPGGADLVGGRLFLHGWVCHDRPKPCGTGLRWGKRKRHRAERAMYAARVRWTDGLPRVAGWIRPR